MDATGTAPTGASAMPMTPTVMPTAGNGNNVGKSNRGKDQIHWGDGVWQALDHAVVEEMMRTRVAAKFLPHVYVDKKQTTVVSDVVDVPPPPDGNTAPDALSIDESKTNRINEYWVQFRLSVAQADAEAHQEMAMAQEMAMNPQMVMSHPQESMVTGAPMAMSQHQMAMRHSQYASTAVSLTLRAANVLAQAEDLVLFNGQNAVKNSPLFTNQRVQFLDKNLISNLDLGLLNIDSNGVINFSSPDKQVIQVFPRVKGSATTPPRYAENTLAAVASAFSNLQALGHYEHYALALHTIPYADLHTALPTTLIEPVEPISHLIKAGVYGTGTLPPFTEDGKGPTGLPTKIGDTAIDGTVRYTGVLVSLSGNTMDHVRGRMEDNLDVLVTFNQRDVNENYRFRVVERFALRLKDPTAVILLLFMNDPAPE